jgi:tryptophan halogenase
VILHYHASERRDTAFWEACRSMPVPDSLSRRIALYRRHGRIAEDGAAVFLERNWVQVLQGQGIHPEGYNPIVDVIGREDIESYFTELRQAIRQLVERMPEHGAFLRGHCGANL